MRPSGYGISLSPNLFYNLEGDKVVYFAAGVGVVHDDESARQKYFLRHDDDIECLSMHEDGDTIASGQYGVEPTVWIWSAKTRQGPRATPSGPGGPDLPGPIKLVLPRGERSVIACCFSPHVVGDKLVTVSTDAQHTVRVWNWSEVVDCTKCTGTGLFNRDTCPLCDGAKLSLRQCSVGLNRRSSGATSRSRCRCHRRSRIARSRLHRLTSALARMVKTMASRAGHGLPMTVPLSRSA